VKRGALVAILIGVVVAISGGVWASGAFRPSGLAAFDREAKTRAEAAKSQRASAGMFRATVCAMSPCVLVEAGGLAFLVGAGEGAAEGLTARGLMRADLDGILLADIELASIEGLPALRMASLQAGRAEPLPVFGPDGVFPAIDGANLMLTGSTSDSARLTAGIEGEDQGLAGKIVFDSGVVTVRAFAQDKGASRVYRVDFSGKSLLIAGCAAKPAELIAAARGTRQVSAIMAVYSPRLREIEWQAAETAGLAPPSGGACMATEDGVIAAQEARLSAGVFWPLYPAPADSLRRRAWKEAATIPAGADFALGEPGMVLDLTAEQPSIHSAK
jgi:hypothetical protein